MIRLCVVNLIQLVALVAILVLLRLQEEIHVGRRVLVLLQGLVENLATSGVLPIDEVPHLLARLVHLGRETRARHSNHVPLDIIGPLLIEQRTSMHCGSAPSACVQTNGARQTVRGRASGDSSGGGETLQRIGVCGV